MPPPESDRNLLFAVLALQADCLTASRFVEACTLWASRKDVPIADLLTERGWLQPDERADVDRLLQRKLKKHAGDAKAGLAEVTADHHVRESLAGIADPDVRATLTGPAPEPGHVLLSTSAVTPEEGDRYTITRLHATGGIGRVWLAKDASLGRDVALKELRPERAGNPAVWERFLREARITGQLEHPGIIPIYEFGRRPETNQPFYTMRFVRGRTLREAAAAYHQKRERGELGPLDLRELLTAFVGVCNAVAYAHSRGVIHRDLKPANVVLGEFGEVMVLDWGLAKEVGKADHDPQQTTDLSSTPNPELRTPHADGTLEGQVLGTPAYMAPEQADGRLADLDPRTDVYGLGAILYEVLTGRPPFTGDDTAAVLSRVRTLAPDRPRDVVPATPRALEAVCLKALQKKPAARYPTAAAVAQDVQRFLADEPTTAYREPLPVRAARWARRRRTLVASFVAVLVVAVPILLAAVVLLERSESRERAARQQAETARAEEAAARGREQAARERAETNYGRSLRASDALSEELARGIRPIAGTQTKTVITILDRAKLISDDLLTDPDPPREALERRARLLVLFADLYRDANRIAASRQAAEQAIDLFNRLLQANPGDRSLRVGRARAHHRLGWTLFDQGYHDESLTHFKVCIDELEAVGTDDDPVLAVTVLASAYTLSANTRLAFGDHPGADRLYQRGLEVRRKAMAAAPTDPDVRTQLAVSLERVGLFELRYRDKDRGAAALREARAELETLCRENPWNTAMHLHLLRTRTSIAQESRDEAERADVLKANQAVVDRFLQRDPDHLLWFREGVRLKHYQIAERMKKVLDLDPPEQLELRRQELQVTEELRDACLRVFDQDAENVFWLADVGNFEARLAEMHFRMIQHESSRKFHHAAAALALARSSVRRYDQILARCPHHAENQLAKFYAQAQLARTELDPAAQLKARWEYSGGEVDLYQRMVAADPQNTHWRGQLALAYFRQSAPLRRAAADPIWDTLARPEVVAPLVRFAGVLADPPPGFPADMRDRADTLRANAGVLLRGLDSRGALPPDGKAILAKLTTAAPATKP